MAPYAELFVTFASAQLLFLVLYLELRHRKFLVARLISLWAICMVGYLIIATPGIIEDRQGLPAFILRRIGSLTTPLLWFISYYMFVDRHDIKPIVWIVTAYYFVSRTVAGIMGYLDYPFTPQTYIFTHLINEVIRFGFIVHALFMITTGYKGDLSVHRRKMRIGCIVVMGALLVATVVNNSYLMFSNFLDALLYSENSEIAFIALADAPIPILSFSVYLYLAALLFMLWQFKVPEEKAAAIFGPAHQFNSGSASNSTLNCEQAKLIEKIKHAMEVEKIYCKRKLAVRDLADHINDHEYKVRIAINKHMGFRNFSDFLNRYRVSEAAERLRESDEKIAYIGLDVGYISLSSFHKAFKETYHFTPREYRTQHQTLS